MEHFKEHYPLYIIYDLTNKKQYEEFISRKWNSWVIGVINYDLVWRREELKYLKDISLMLDESSLIQNESSKRTKFILIFLNPCYLAFLFFIHFLFRKCWVKL